MNQHDFDELRADVLGIYKQDRNVFIAHLRLIILLSLAQVLLQAYIAWQLLSLYEHWH